MLKKWISLLLCIALILSGTAGCFAAEEDVVASDYSDRANWLAIPMVSKEVDTFYIYPTSFNDASEGAPVICSIDSEMLHEGAKGCYESQATAYEASTNVFAPYYRQVNMMAVTSISAEERVALLEKEPKADLFAALDFYFEHLNGGRPFILAGHSQGSQMMTYVLTEYMEQHPDYYERMVAAYALGYSITKQLLDDHPNLKFAEGADDTGVIISWNTEGEGNADAANFVVEEGAIAINPLNWKRDDTYAGREECRGARIQNAETGKFELTPEAADAQLNVGRGVVVTHTDVLAPMDESMGFGPESYHGGDYTLWYTNIRDNVKTRVDAWLKAKRASTRKEIKVIDMEHHYYTQDFYDLAAKRTEAPIYYPETNTIEYVPGVVMPLPPPSVFWMDDARIEAMDQYGVDQAMLEISPGLEVIEGEEGVALCRAANDLVYEAMQKYPGRFYGSAVLPIRDVDAAVAELERCVKEYGFVSWHTHSNYGDSFLDDEQYRPILKKAAELGVYVYLHPNMPVESRINERGWAFSAAAFGFTEDCMATTLALITRGVFDEIPGLQIVTGHFGEAVPFLLDRMDAHLAADTDDKLLQEHEISWYFRHNIWVTTSGNMSVEAFECARDVLGLDRILLGTDYPYETFEEEMSFLYGLDLTDEECELLYHGNAERLMHLNTK